MRSKLHSKKHKGNLRIKWVVDLDADDIAALIIGSADVHGTRHNIPADMEVIEHLAKISLSTYGFSKAVNSDHYDNTDDCEALATYISVAGGFRRDGIEREAECPATTTS